jgi:hypothetical protein
MRFCDTLSLEDKFCYEKIRNKFCKYILGLKKIACNISAKSELGRFPITDYIKTQAILYFFRLQTDLINPLLKAVDLGYPKMFPSFNFKKFHRAVFSIAHPKYSNFGGILDARMMVILVSEDSNRYAHLFLIEREYFGFNTLECCC